MRCPFRGEYVRDVSSDGADWRVPPLYGRRNEDNMGYRKGIGAYNGGSSNPNMHHAREVIDKRYL
jgi:hypothetical protein